MLDKRAPAIDLALPAPGVYTVTIFDAQSARRIDFLLAAITPAQSAALGSFPRVKELLAEWNTGDSGWPTHELLRAYIRSLMQE